MYISPIGQDTNDVTNTTAAGTASGDFAACLDGQDDSLSAIFQEAANTYGVPISLLTAMAKQESNFQADATSRSGAMGIMQLMPATASYFGVEDPYDPKENIMAGAKYISQLLDKYNGDTSLALAAYNAGSGNVSKYGGIPPFKETQNYVAKILGYMEEGVTLPDGSRTAAGTAASGSGADPASTGGISGAGTAAGGSGSLSAAEAGSSSPLEDLLDRFFSYNDYLRFLDLFLKNLDEFTAAGGSSHDKDAANAGSDAAAATTQAVLAERSDASPYQGIRYSQSVLRLLTERPERL